MKEVMFYEKKNSTAQCRICPHNCVIAKDHRGFCGVRENQNGKLYLLVYGHPVSVCIDPIEKKPLFHFLPGTDIYSIGTVGCNLRCKHCQNWQISQEKDIFGEKLTPEEVVENALKENCSGIAYTYTEPTIFYEYVYDTARLARKKGLKNIMVTNGYINQEPLKKLYPYIDGANVDLKGFTEKFYREITASSLAPVLESLKTIKKMKNVWLEVTNLIIPTLNDNMKTIKEMCIWIKDNLGDTTPLHFSRFFPFYKLEHLPPTPEETLIKARDIALKTGLKFVYIGNILIEDTENTYCPKCKELLIERKGFMITQNNLKEGKCSCGEQIPGVWK
ncbi:AmmeMemoRadiSam system radical SAM enzyme [Candidatus Woesearchaeota archaeon]|nr:AmmeMemoRadiSam system radical SAM enzyme [Candidatus Woesearchaeota archaeon]